MVELIKRIIPYHKVIEALTAWWPHVTRLVLGVWITAAVLVAVIAYLIYRLLSGG